MEKSNQEKIVNVHLRDLEFLQEDWENLISTWRNAQHGMQGLEDILEICRRGTEVELLFRKKLAVFQVWWRSLYDDLLLLSNTCQGLHLPFKSGIWSEPLKPVSRQQDELASLQNEFRNRG
jgi:hypothetical protein